MLEYYLEHWYLIPILLALAAVTVIVWIKALRKRALTNRERSAELARLEEQKSALDAYRAWKNSAGGVVTDKQIFTGFALDLQSKLQYEPDQSAAYLALPEDARQLYALYFALEDAPYDKISQFFGEYGKPLTGEANAAMRRFAGADTAEIFAKLYAAYDPDDEAASLIPAQITEWDAAFANALEMEPIYARAAEMLR